MMLSGCNVLPQGILPLFIFEPRYRAMLAHALGEERMFCIGTLTGKRGDESDEAISPCSTAGLVRACVGHADGTSHLVLQGVQRIRFTGWDQREPFRIARIEPIETCGQDSPEVAGLRRDLLQRTLHLLEKAPADTSQIATQLSSMECPDLMTDFIASNLVQDARMTQPLLGMPDLPCRMRFLLETLQRFQ